MPSPPARLPRELLRLLSARAGSEQDEAWGKFLAAHTNLLLHTGRTAGFVLVGGR